MPSPAQQLSFTLALLAGLPAAALAAAALADVPQQQKPKLLAVLPDACPTPDGMAIDPEGNLVVACPNYADATKPACLVKIDRRGRLTPWVNVPPLAATGRACPMGIEFGPDGDLYVCDNQNWAGGNGAHGEINQGRILRLRIDGDKVVRCTTIANGLSHPNGIRVRDGHVYVTVSMLPKVKRDDGLLTSAVYRFACDDQNVEVQNTLDDKHILATFVTLNRDCQYGADGLAFDSRGNLFVGNFGDGSLHKLGFDARGKLTRNEVFAKTDLDTPMSSADFPAKMVAAKMRTTDGICIDANDNIYVADFSNNAVCRVDRQGVVTVLAQSPDGDGSDGGLDQPGEPIVWNGKLVVTCFDVVVGRDKVNTKHDRPSTIVTLELP